MEGGAVASCRRRSWVLPAVVLALGAALAAAACTPSAGSESEATPAHLSEHPAFEGVAFPIAVGHAGAKLLCPENTLECYQMALDAGAGALEADLQVLGDGTLVMFHDDNAFAQTGVDVELRSATVGEMRDLDLGYGFSPDGGRTHPYREMGIVVATLDEFLGAFPDVPVLLDVKAESPEMAEALIAFARDWLLEEDRQRLYIKSNDPRLAQGLRALDPAPRVALSRAERVALVLALLAGEEPTIPDAGPTWVDLDTDIQGFDHVIDLVGTWARLEGHLLTASTVNDPGEMVVLLDAGDVDGLVTDRPDLQTMLEP